MAELHNTLKDLRKSKGMTQADLAEAAGVSRKTINTIDADGVSLAAIQALYQSFEEEKKNHEILVKALVERIEILESKLDKIK